MASPTLGRITAAGRRALGHVGRPADDRVDLPAEQPAQLQRALVPIPELRTRRSATPEANQCGRVIYTDMHIQTVGFDRQRRR